MKRALRILAVVAAVEAAALAAALVVADRRSARLNDTLHNPNDPFHLYGPRPETPLSTRTPSKEPLT